MVRTKVQVTYIADDQRRRVCFAKRRGGLMKKAHELSLLCNADVAVIVFSETGRLYQSDASNIPRIITRYNMATDLPPPPQPHPDVARLMAEQAEELRNLREQVRMLEAENRFLMRELEVAESNNQPVPYENATMETSRTLRRIRRH